MSIKNQLERKIQAKTQEINELEGKLREAKAYLQGLQDIYRMLPKDSTDERKPEQILRPGSDMANAREMLLKAGKPLHISDILRGLGKEVNKSNRVSVSSSLGSYARKKQIFTAVGGNTFGLIEFKSNGNNELAEGEPPEDFGMDDDEEADVE